MKLIPTKKQWNSWTLPSKHNSIALLLTLLFGTVAIVGIVYQVECGPTKGNQEKSLQNDETIMQTMNDIAENVITLESRYADELEERYPAGYVFFSVT